MCEQPATIINMVDEDSSTDEDECCGGSNASNIEQIELPIATQGTTGSFSSLIDYNPDNASDRSDLATSSPSSTKSSTGPVTSVSDTTGTRAEEGV
jgi:hypothetical protein